MSSELSRIQRLAARFGGHAAEGVALGIGDDAAVLRPPPGVTLVWTVDAQVDGVHFRRAWMSMEDIGWRSFVAAASDLWAMGAGPWCALSALTCPGALTAEELDALSIGQAEAARAAGCPIVGGNLSRGSELSITTTLLGTCARAVSRGGACVGDSVFLAGAVGLAAAGLGALTSGRSGSDLDAAIEAFRRPTLRLAEGAALGRVAHAAIDVSDGLVQDVAHLATSSHVGVVLEEALLRAHAGDALARAAVALGRDALGLMLTGGEDYALVAAGPTPIEGFTKVGEIVAGAGVRLRTGGVERALEAAGFDHFRP